MRRHSLVLPIIMVFCLFFIDQMLTIHTYRDEIQRYQRGFGNRRSAVDSLRRLWPRYTVFIDEDDPLMALIDFQQNNPSSSSLNPAPIQTS